MEIQNLREINQEAYDSVLYMKQRGIELGLVGANTAQINTIVAELSKAKMALLNAEDANHGRSEMSVLRGQHKYVMSLHKLANNKIAGELINYKINELKVKEVMKHGNAEEIGNAIDSM